MAEYRGESPEVIAKEIALAFIDKRGIQGGADTPGAGEIVGRLYKVILKHVREAIQEEKYD